MQFPEGEGPETGKGFIDMETGFDLSLPLGLQQASWETPQERELLERLKDRRAAAGIPEVDDLIVGIRIEDGTPRVHTEPSEPAPPLARFKTAKKPRSRQPLKSARVGNRAKSLHGDLETS